jgi:hypothetical protein
MTLLLYGSNSISVYPSFLIVVGLTCGTIPPCLAALKTEFVPPKPTL